MKYIEIKADTNDGDYISAIGKIDDEDLEKIKPLIDAIKAFDRSRSWGHNWPNGDCSRDGDEAWDYYEKLGITEEQIDILGDYVPFGENGVHSIEAIRVYEVTNVEELL